MTTPAKAVHPIRVGGGIIKPGGDIAPEMVGEKRLSRLVAKGRAAFQGEAATVNRAISQTGRPDVKLPDKATDD